MIAIVDYGAGNLRSVANAITKLGYQPKITSRADELSNAQAVILPGVGAAADTMENLEALGLVSLIRQLIAEDRPFFGVCIGLQILFTGTEEGGWHECLNVIPGKVRRLLPGLKVPHMVWNEIAVTQPHPILQDVNEGDEFYFVHSYYPRPCSFGHVFATCEYELTFPAVIGTKNLFAVQFHPEKSGRVGLTLLRNFAQWDGGSPC